MEFKVNLKKIHLIIIIVIVLLVIAIVIFTFRVIKRTRELSRLDEPVNPDHIRHLKRNSPTSQSPGSSSNEENVVHEKSPTKSTVKHQSGCRCRRCQNSESN